MAITWKQEPDDILVAHITGKLALPEIKEFQTAVEPVIRASGNIKFLVILDSFQGWAKGEGWENTDFADANDQFLSKFAIVGDEKWRNEALMFSLAGLRPVDIQYFPSGDEAAARTWLTGD